MSEIKDHAERTGHEDEVFPDDDVNIAEKKVPDYHKTKEFSLSQLQYILFWTKTLSMNIKNSCHAHTFFC